jgi:hypothetical protein
MRGISRHYHNATARHHSLRGGGGRDGGGRAIPPQ